jgi:hypothetical protein
MPEKGELKSQFSSPEEVRGTFQHQSDNLFTVPVLIGRHPSLVELRPLQF